MDIIDQYTLQFPVQDTYTNKLHNLIVELIKGQDTHFHIIEKRTKTIESFKSKIERKKDKYLDPLNEITDLTGLRIILYYHDDIDRVIRMIKKEFTIDEINSNYKKANSSPDVFGYTSTHIIVSINNERGAWTEWSKYSLLKAEIQIKTVLQHAWASISHALQYKSKEDIPSKLQRQLFRLAGLFELADEEFLSIRDKHFQLLDKIGAIENIEKSNNDINLLTIEKYITDSALVSELFGIAINTGFSDIKNLSRVKEDVKFNFSQLVTLCHKFEISKIRDLHDILLRGKSNAVLAFSKVFKAHKEATIKGSPWYTSNEFSVTLLLVNEFIADITIEDLVSNGWASHIAERIITALRS